MGFQLTDAQQKIFVNALSRCGECVDVQGWRYTKELGADDYNPIDVNDSDMQKQFFVSIKFLRTMFPYKGTEETIDSINLRDAAEWWWEKIEDESVPIENGIMLVAIVACGLAPKDLWLSMNVEQKAYINMNKWKKFCEDFEFEFDLEKYMKSSQSDE